MTNPAGRLLPSTTPFTRLRAGLAGQVLVARPDTVSPQPEPGRVPEPESGQVFSKPFSERSGRPR